MNLTKICSRNYRNSLHFNPQRLLFRKSIDGNRRTESTSQDGSHDKPSGLNRIKRFFQRLLIVGVLSTVCTFGGYQYLSINGYLNFLSPPPTNLRSRFNFIDKVVKKCAPSVVYIEIKDPRRMDPETGAPITASNGSGFLVSEDGWIVTNAHVIIDKPQAIIMVMMDDGTKYKATVQDADMNVDLALLKIDANKKLPYLEMGKPSDVSTGEWVVALGSPLSLSHSVTAGVVSSVNRGAEELGLKNMSMKYIQTDAAITFGNSGGPLCNLDGKVIGINNLRVTAGIAFAIPIEYAQRFLERSQNTMFKKKKETEPKQFLGLTTISVTSDLIEELLQKYQAAPDEIRHGLYVWKIAKDSVASGSELEVGDIITHVNDVPVHDSSDIYVAVGKKHKLKVYREGKVKHILLTSDSTPN